MSKEDVVCDIMQKKSYLIINRYKKARYFRCMDVGYFL